MATIIEVYMFLAAVIVSSLLHQYVQAKDGQFYGGSMSYKMKKQADGKDLVTIELITGWVLGKGPCGPQCNRSDIGRSTRSTRPIMTAVFKDYLGLYTSDYTNTSTRKTDILDMNALVRSSYNETVLAVSEHEQREQDLLHFSFTMPDNVEELDVNFDGKSWRKLTLQNITHSRWHLQTTVSTSLRSDTGSPNQSPQAFAKLFYRVKLGVGTGIHIPAIDADGDIIKCDIAEYVEGGEIAIYRPPNVQVYENCTVYINASESSGYVDNSWIAVPVSVRDYNRKKIVYGAYDYMPGKFSMSTTAVQFTVQVLAKLITPEFVEPTLEGNYLFIMYADTTLRTEIYANAPTNTTIQSFTAFGLQREQINLSPLQQDPRRPQVKYAIMSWKPSTSEIGGHILCFNTRDNTGVDSEEERCFILDVKADAFNHTSKVTAGKPYFVDIPTPDQFVDCKLHATCVVALYVKSSVEVIDVHVTDSYIDKYKLGPLHMVTHKGEQMYQTDLSFEHSLYGKENICFMAKDKHGAESEDVCIQIKIDPLNACVSAPCLNSGTCVMDEDTGGFNCLCLSGYSGKLCDIKEDKCVPDPCVHEHTVICAGVPGMLCYCKPGFEGDTCDKNTDDCHANTCNGHGSCKDKDNDFECECFSRFNGTRCENDTCPTQARGIMSCPAAGCVPNPCHGGAVCLSGGRCSCSYGFTGNRCETRTCDISGAVTGVEIISPSAADGSKFVCYTQGDTITSCKSRIYMAVKSGVKPNIDVETTSDLKSIITVGPITKSSVLPGVSTMYSTDVTIRGKMNSTKLQYFCVHASVGTLMSSACYELSLISDPESDPKTLAYTQRNANIKFVQPTLKDRSRILCKIGEKCHVLMYTSFASSRSTCLSAPTASSGSSTGCDSNDKDNDQDDPDTSIKTSDPCCEDLLSSTADVTVYPAHPRGPSCVTEASFIFASAGEKEICFQSSKASFQQVCYKVGVNNSTSDPCSNSPCLNNGHCFHSDHNNFKCICDDNYNGDRCQKGPCQLADNNCQHDAYCQTNDGVATCICRAGYSGKTCNKDPSSLHKSTAEFTDTAKPLVFPCVIYQTCSIALLLTGPSGHVPLVAPGYVDSSIVLGEIKTADRIPLQGSYQTDIKIKPFELGVKDMCIQTMNITGVNKDELCFKVNVISDVISIYGFKDRPHFIQPSMPTNTEVECLAEGPCHVLYHVTPGTGNENECVTFHAHPPDGFVNYHLYSSCNNCTPGGSSNGNCAVDVSVVNTNADINAIRRFCLSVGLKGSSIEGEIRCFNITVKDPSKLGKTGCQVLECGNGGFCDGHDPSQPVCFCRTGFSGTNCERGLTGIKSSMSNTQIQTFIGDYAVPSKIICVLNTSCPVPFQIVSKPGIPPAVSLGFNDPHLVVGTPSLKAQCNSSTVFEGSVLATPNTVGDFKLCLQANLNSKTDDEMCILIEVISKSIDKTDKTKPYFLSPTIATDSTVLCAVHKACHFDMHFTKGDYFGFVGRCPTLTETSHSPAQGVHIFNAKSQVTECTTDVTYMPSVADGEPKLCLQVSLPGKKGENRCYIIKVVNDTHKEVLSPCRGVICEHGGTCLANFKSTSPTTSCICAPGFTGNNCETDIDDCRPDSCQNGATCVDIVNNYTCACKLGFTGRDYIGDCVPNPCQNGATCTDEGNNYTCTCALGYTGQNCDIVIDPCSFNPCVRGTCFHHAPLYHCLCPSGYTGKKCEISIDECISHPCLHGGICVNHTGYFTCNCSSGFVGNTCETDVNECISQPCLNGGFCKDGIDQFLCECLAGYDGERCQNVVDPCVRNPCVRGICFSHGSQFLCECPKGFTGEVCETTMTVNGPKETYLRVSAGSELKLNCNVSGQNVLTFYWSKRNGCGFKFGNMKASVYRQPHVFIGDAGTYICTASDGYGPNITKYFHVDITSIQKDEVCDFDDGTLCGWEQHKNDSFDWTVQSGPTQSAGTGPDVDHTLGTVQGKYIYIESSSPRRFGEHASLLSHVLPANRTMCFQFWYYMFGDGSGGLSVLLQDTCLNTETQLFKESGDKGAQWNKASISITRQSVPNDFKIVLKAEVGPTFHGDTAVDDLIIHDGPCQGTQGAPIVG